MSSNQRWDSDLIDRVWLVPARVGWAAWPWLIALSIFAGRAGMSGPADILNGAGVAAALVALIAIHRSLWMFRRRYGGFRPARPFLRRPSELKFLGWLAAFPGERTFPREGLVFAAWGTGQVVFLAAFAISLLDDGT